MDMEGTQMELASVDGLDAMLQEQLLDRRQKLQVARAYDGVDPDFARLLNEVDTALLRFEQGTYGICEECHDPIEPERLLADPLTRVCLGDLTDKQRRSLESDLELAADIQRGLLPRVNQEHDLWKVHFVYEPAGIVSGDYCDFVYTDDALYFILGDVSGKGMAASLLMSNLHATFRSMIPLGLPLDELMARANHLLCESTAANQYATLVYGKLDRDGELEIVNAGHLPPIMIKNGVRGELRYAGLPLGMFCDTKFESTQVKLNKGDALFLFTDGVTEARNVDGTEYGADRLFDILDGFCHGDPKALIEHCHGQVSEFRGTADRHDDLTMLAVAYAG
jgi:sigma-B regulation protein RsbU (phosphoserine phosphatase)